MRDLVPHVLPELEPGRVHADLLGEGENGSSVLLLGINKSFTLSKNIWILAIK